MGHGSSAPTPHLRSAAYLAVGDLESAAADGRMCIDIDPRFVKGARGPGMAGTARDAR